LINVIQDILQGYYNDPLLQYHCPGWVRAGFEWRQVHALKGKGWYQFPLEVGPGMIFRMINLCAIVNACMVLHDGQVTLRTFHCRNPSAYRVAIICVGIGVHMIDFF
jgi:hypothetical protein